MVTYEAQHYFGDACLLTRTLSISLKQKPNKFFDLFVFLIQKFGSFLIQWDGALHFTIPGINFRQINGRNGIKSE